MRVIAELPHPDCKISIFSMNQKYIIKLEKGVFEQIYKISELDVPDGVDGIFKILNEDFLKKSAERFNEMRADFNTAYKKYDEF
ncbi:hypothetical protein [Daejeonella sp.]|jgi:H2-forming N5,N10-methylenetetrahydromethanopterin dehydrogenase-like enzyme|uniref:hypothetical protein n=1 Tax=Daejeonella sp. TaxID=2805397 RepID=UPI0037850F50